MHHYISREAPLTIDLSLRRKISSMSNDGEEFKGI